MGVCGYMRFGSIVEDNILLNYIDLTWTNTLLFNSAGIAMVVCLVVSYPLILFPSRMCFHVLLKDALPKGLKNFSGSFYFRAETFFIVGNVFCSILPGSSNQDRLWSNWLNHRMLDGIYFANGILHERLETRAPVLPGQVFFPLWC